MPMNPMPNMPKKAKKAAAISVPKTGNQDLDRKIVMTMPITMGQLKGIKRQYGIK